MRWLVSSILVILLGACSATPRPDFRQLHDFGHPTARQPPVIVIPMDMPTAAPDGGR